jgi:hypothetical protein
MLEFLQAGDVLMVTATIASPGASETCRISFARSGRGGEGGREGHEAADRAVGKCFLDTLEVFAEFETNLAVDCAFAASRLCNTRRSRWQRSRSGFM